MTDKEYEYITYKISELLNSDDITNKDGIISFYDMIEYAKRGMKDYLEVTDYKSKLAKELNDSNLFNKTFNKYYTCVKTEKTSLDNKCKSFIMIATEKEGMEVILSKNKNSKLIIIEPSNEKTQNLVQNHYSTIMQTFLILENYSNFFKGIGGKKYSYKQAYGNLFYIELEYSDYGKINTEIKFNSKYDLEYSKNGKDSLKQIIKLNKDKLLKKIPIDLNENLMRNVNNHILLLAKEEYLKESEDTIQLHKRKILK